VRTYADEGKSGLSIAGRASLQKLIADVECGNTDFNIILVYDVSRWGRFQDADESACYEYICKRKGITVAYVAEQFENDGSPVSTIVKGGKRAIEGAAILMIVVPASALVRSLVAPDRLSTAMGYRGTFMPTGTATAMLLGPLLMAHFGWATWWETLGAIALLMALLFNMGVPRVAGARAQAANLQRLRLVWRTPQVRRVALAFACYSGQWLVIIGFLPTLLQTGGMSAGFAGTIAAIASAVNIVGNIAGGRLLQKGVPSQRVLGIAFATLAAGAFVVCGTPSDTPFIVRLAAVLMFSGVGGMIPGSLFSLAVRAAPTEETASTALGWTTQMSLLGQFPMLPIAAALATAHGSWALTWVVTVSLCLIGILLTRQPTARA
jgi:CP family cyanate transporter-like MFS transporter